MQNSFPQMFENSTILNNSVEEVLKESYEKYDLIYTMAVLEHIHVDSEWIFNEMVKLTNKFIITIEDEKSISWKHFPRRYKRIFENLGMKEIEFLNCSRIKGFHKGFYYRLFEKTSNKK